jgi:hypothetical protein
MGYHLSQATRVPLRLDVDDVASNIRRALMRGQLEKTAQMHARAGDMMDAGSMAAEIQQVYDRAACELARQVGSGEICFTSIGQNPFTETIYFRKYSVTRGFRAKIPVHEICATGAILGVFGQFWASRGCFCISTPFTSFF